MLFEIVVTIFILIISDIRGVELCASYSKMKIN